ncbi:MAG: coenzyme Q-binding protein COQ10 [Candidatus Midichloriaceae bacterium]|jgi:coenzyme Q-binding protein COQ10
MNIKSNNNTFNFSSSKEVEHTLEEVIDVVLKIEDYPKFLPWCKKAKIISHEEDKIIADLIISFKGINVKYRSLITIQKDASDVTIKTSSIEGPFKFLDSYWVLKKVAKEKTNIKFEIKFLLNSNILQKIMSKMMKHASNKILLSFEKRLSNKA